MADFFLIYINYSLAYCLIIWVYKVKSKVCGEDG